MGADAFVNGFDTPEYSAVTALAGYVNKDEKIYFGHPEPEIISKPTFESLDHYFEGLQGVFRGRFTFRLYRKIFPDAPTTISAFWDVIEILKKPYLFLYSDNYPYLILSNDRTYQVGLNSISIEHADDKGVKYMTLEFKTVATI